MRHGGLMDPLGGEGKIVEADETYFSPREVYQHAKKNTSTRYLAEFDFRYNHRAWLQATLQAARRTQTHH
jgi:hypothetical protein